MKFKIAAFFCASVCIMFLNTECTKRKKDMQSKESLLQLLWKSTVKDIRRKQKKKRNDILNNLHYLIVKNDFPFDPQLLDRYNIVGDAFNKSMFSLIKDLIFKGCSTPDNHLSSYMCSDDKKKDMIFFFLQQGADPNKDYILNKIQRPYDIRLYDINMYLERLQIYIAYGADINSTFKYPYEYFPRTPLYFYYHNDKIRKTLLELGANPLIDCHDLVNNPEELKQLVAHAIKIHDPQVEKYDLFKTTFENYTIEDQDLIKLAISTYFYRADIEKLNLLHGLAQATNKTDSFNVHDLFKKSLEFYTTNPERLPNKRIAYFAQLMMSEKLHHLQRQRRGSDVHFAWQ